MLYKPTDKTADEVVKYPFNKFFFKWVDRVIDEPMKVAIKIAVIYLAAGALWILLSDKFLDFIASDKETMTHISMVKGWVYVIVSGMLIFSLIYSFLKRIQRAEAQLVTSYRSQAAANQELKGAYEKLAVSEEELRLNITELKKYEQKLQHLAYHDQLTGLPNRVSMNDRLNGLIGKDASGKKAVLFIDIDNFKYVNDTMGHSFGDKLIVKVSERLGSLLEKNQTIFRWGGDEFIIIADGFEKVEDMEKLAVKILKQFKSTFEIGSSSLYITVSIGVSIYPFHGNNADELLKNADIAVYKAKEEGRNRIVFYNEPMNEAVSERMLIERNLHGALAKNEFELYYQPQLDIASNQICGFEALIRWRNEELGFVSPQKFIGVAEDTHLIIPIGEWVLRNACLFLRKLHRQGYPELTMSVNISMLQLLQDNFTDMVMKTLETSKISPRHLEIEITESILMESYEMIAGKLKLLKEQGIKIALDDFGKGYSSLNYLRQLPISTLKIDKSFVDTISTNDKKKSLANLIVKIGRSMDMCVIAEGVETQEQMDYLVKHRCNKIQGYLFSKPIPENEVLGKIKV